VQLLNFVSLSSQVIMNCSQHNLEFCNGMVQDIKFSMPFGNKEEATTTLEDLRDLSEFEKSNPGQVAAGIRDDDGDLYFIFEINSGSSAYTVYCISVRLSKNQIALDLSMHATLGYVTLFQGLKGDHIILCYCVIADKTCG
jgi:hypothetical protein